MSIGAICTAAFDWQLSQMSQRLIYQQQHRQLHNGPGAGTGAPGMEFVGGGVQSQSLPSGGPPGDSVGGSGGGAPHTSEAHGGTHAPAGAEQPAFTATYAAAAAAAVPAGGAAQGPLQQQKEPLPLLLLLLLSRQWPGVGAAPARALQGTLALPGQRGGWQQGRRLPPRQRAGWAGAPGAAGQCALALAGAG